MVNLSVLRSSSVFGLILIGLGALSWPSVNAVSHAEVGSGVQNLLESGIACSCVTMAFDGRVVETDQRHTMSAGLKPGDHVRQGQVLAVIRSTELGEKKSRLLAAASRLMSDEEALVRQTVAGADANTLAEMRQHCQLDRARLLRAEHTLEELALSREEIAQLYELAVRLHADRSEQCREQIWAEFAVHAPRDGVLVQANATAGSNVHPGSVLFTIADGSRESPDKVLSSETSAPH